MRVLDDLPDLNGLRVLMRADFNVPLKAGVITDDTRIRLALPTVKELLARGASVVLMSHLGRPGGKVVPELSLAPVAARLGELLQTPVQLAEGVVSERVQQAAAELQPGQLLLLENLRFEPGETQNSAELAAALASLGDVYVNDAFGAAHRAHASTEGVTHHVETAVAGRLLEREVVTFERILESPKRPLVAVVGGAKVTDKIGVIQRFMEIADAVLIGGAMCFPFFKAQGIAVGASLCEEDGVLPARAALEAAKSSGCELLLPTDLVAATEFSADATPVQLDTSTVPEGLMGLDIGAVTAKTYADRVLNAQTVFWNGPMGAFELAPFSAGTRTVAEAVAATAATTVVGGGDSAAALTAFGLEQEVTHLSTGGGASLELIEGKTLPGVEALR